MKHLRLFKQDAEYQQFKDSSDFILPNVSYVVELDLVDFNPYAPSPQKAGDIVYYVNGDLKTIGYTDWSSELGTPVGVITIPEGFAPDGKARMVALSEQANIAWNKYSIDTSLTNYAKVPITDNASSTSSGSSDYGYLPSDRFTGATSYVDPVTKYARTNNMIPSPYLTIDDKNEPNPEYYKEISGNNALSDFNGLENTEVLVGLGTDYTAANVCWNYNDGVSDIQWYLPACGELGYILPRFNEINAGLAKVNAVQLSFLSYWSSSECREGSAYYMGTSNGNVSTTSKYTTNRARPWAIVE